MIDPKTFLLVITFLAAPLYSIVWGVYQRHIIEAAITKDQYHVKRWHYWGGWVRGITGLFIALMNFNAYGQTGTAIISGTLFLLTAWALSDIVLNLTLETKPGLFYRSKKHPFDRVPFWVRFLLIVFTWILILWKI